MSFKMAKKSPGNIGSRRGKPGTQISLHFLHHRQPQLFRLLTFLAESSHQLAHSWAWSSTAPESIVQFQYVSVFRTFRRRVSCFSGPRIASEIHHFVPKQARFPAKHLELLLLKLDSPGLFWIWMCLYRLLEPVFDLKSNLNLDLVEALLL